MATFSAPAAKEHVKGLRAQIVHRADQEFPFLHDTMIVPLGGRLLMAWYNCSENEIVGRTIIRGRWSADHGQTWSEPEIICEDVRPEHHMVPVTFTEENGEIWAYVTRMSSHDRPTGYVCVQYDHGQWKLRQEREELVLINTLPQETDGEWIAGGRMAAKPGELPLIPVVVRAPKQSPAPWKIVALPGPWNEDVYPLEYPETAVLVEKDRVDAIVRNDAGPAQAFHSTDGGKTWGKASDAQMPIAPAKMYGGSLPDGRQYLIYNEQTERKDRSRLVLALSRGGDAPFDRALLLADGPSEALNAGPYWHYPCACIDGKMLHISCTSSADTVVRHAALFSIPLENL